MGYITFATLTISVGQMEDYVHCFNISGSNQSINSQACTHIQSIEIKNLLFQFLCRHSTYRIQIGLNLVAQLYIRKVEIFSTFRSPIRARLGPYVHVSSLLYISRQHIIHTIYKHNHETILAWHDLQS